jgi:hypothetical protein
MGEWGGHGGIDFPAKEKVGALAGGKERGEADAKTCHAVYSGPIFGFGKI